LSHSQASLGGQRLRSQSVRIRRGSCTASSLTSFQPSLQPSLQPGLQPNPRAPLPGAAPHRHSFVEGLAFAKQQDADFAEMLEEEAADASGGGGGASPLPQRPHTVDAAPAGQPRSFDESQGSPMKARRGMQKFESFCEGATSSPKADFLRSRSLRRSRTSLAGVLPNLPEGEEAVSRSTSSQLPQKMRLEETPGDDAAGAGSLRTSAPPNSSRFHDQASSRESRRSTGGPPPTPGSVISSASHSQMLTNDGPSTPKLIDEKRLALRRARSSKAIIMDSEEERIAVRGVGKKMAQFSGLFRHRKGSIIEGEEEEGEEGGDARGGNAAMLRQPKSMIDLGTRRQWSAPVEAPAVKQTTTMADLVKSAQQRRTGAAEGAEAQTFDHNSHHGQIQSPHEVAAAEGARPATAPAPFLDRAQRMAMRTSLTFEAPTQKKESACATESKRVGFRSTSFKRPKDRQREEAHSPSRPGLLDGDELLHEIRNQRGSIHDRLHRQKLNARSFSVRRQMSQETEQQPATSAIKRSVSTGRLRIKPIQPINPNMKNRITAQQRRMAYANALEKYRDRPVTHIKAGGGVVVAVRDLNNLKKYFDELDADGSGTIEAHEIEEKVEEAANLRKLRSEGKMSDEEWERLQLKYQKIGLGMGSNESTISCTQLLKFMDESGSLTWKGMLKMMYPKASKEGIQRMADVHEASEGMETSAPDMADLKDLNDLWDIWDEDGNGELDKDEFKMALKMLHVPVEDVDTIYYSIDDDGNGTISKSEFAAWWFTDQTSDKQVHVNLDGPQETVKLSKSAKLKLREQMWSEHMKMVGLASAMGV